MSAKEEFKKTIKKANKEIEKHLNDAWAALEKAQEVSEKYGVPFYSQISPLSQNYTPDSFDSKWRKELEEALEAEAETEEDSDYYDSVEEFLSEECGVSLNEYGDAGWAHSAVC